MSEPLISFHDAVTKITRELGISYGKAQSMLRQACAVGEIRSHKEPYSIVDNEPQGEGPPERIEPSEWRVSEIDMMTDADGCNYFVHVDRADFQHWLDSQKPPTKQTQR